MKASNNKVGKNTGTGKSQPGAQHTPAAVALKYDGERAPTISAVGNHQLADEIVRIAREHGVPLYENAELASTLAQLSLNDEIPEQLYQLVAEILAFAFHIRGLTPEDAGKPD